MVIQHNLLAINTVRQNSIIGKEISSSTEKLSSGYRINRSADDAASLSISEKMRYQIRGLYRGLQNAQDGVSMIQVADGALEEVHNMLQRMGELAIQAANDANANEDRQALQKEVDEIASEISRIGKNTTFNGLYIFDTLHPGQKVTSITSLVHCAAAESGHLTEVYKSTQTNKYHPAANLDFSGINASNISYLYDKSFSFTCSQACPETFTFTMIDKDGMSSTSENLSGRVEHKYTIDIHGMTTGAEIVDALYNYVAANPPVNNSAGTSNKIDGGLGVSHSNVMLKASPTVLTIFAVTGYATQQGAEKKFANSTSVYGAIDASQIVNAIPAAEGKNIIPIQTGFVASDHMDVTIEKMNAQILGVDKLKVTSFVEAQQAIDKIQKAIQTVSDNRSVLGAQQNRLEHSIGINANTEENTQSAESKLRDTEISEEVVKLSKANILSSLNANILKDIHYNTNDILMLFQ